MKPAAALDVILNTNGSADLVCNRKPVGVHHEAVLTPLSCDTLITSKLMT